jgi:hypothetical protein
VKSFGVRVAMEICGMTLPGSVAVNGVFALEVGKGEVSRKRVVSARGRSEGWSLRLP